MNLLIGGLILWVIVHLFPSLGKHTRSNIVAKIGLGPYKGLFALLILSSVVLIVFGWRSVIPQPVYEPPEWGKFVTFVLVLVTFILFIAAKRKTNIKRYLRHPQLTGLVIWSIGHLFANGDNRSLILFITLGTWAIVQMICINQREGAWKKPELLPARNDIITVVGGCILYTVLLFAHPYITGVSLF